MYNKTKKPTKQQYLLEIEVLVPTTIKYRVLAEDSDEALREYHKTNPLEKPQFNLNKAKKIRARIYNCLTGRIELIRDL